MSRDVKEIRRHLWKEKSSGFHAGRLVGILCLGIRLADKSTRRMIMMYDHRHWNLLYDESDTQEMSAHALRSRNYPVAYEWNKVGSPLARSALSSIHTSFMQVLRTNIRTMSHAHQWMHEKQRYQESKTSRCLSRGCGIHAHSTVIVNFFREWSYNKNGESSTLLWTEVHQSKTIFTEGKVPTLIMKKACDNIPT